jgi:hydroxymethylpyrimidine/phosphomethylpyrimidine kinase
VALTIAGSDSGGGAGIAADLKTFEALGVWGTVAVAAVTAQNTVGVVACHLVPADLICRQIEAVAADIGIDAAKVGMLGSFEAVQAVAAAVRAAGIGRLVVDPVLVSKHGDRLLSDDGLRAMRDELLAVATVVTPNLDEAAALLGVTVATRDQMEMAAAALHRLGPEVVLLKGGHLADGGASPDLVFSAEGPVWLEGPRMDAVHTHGTGCVLSAAIAAEMARGRDPTSACAAAKQFVTRAIRAGLPLGRGIGPIDPGWDRASR